MPITRYLPLLPAQQAQGKNPPHGLFWVISSVVERFLDAEEAESSILSSPTTQSLRPSLVFPFFIPEC